MLRDEDIDPLGQPDDWDRVVRRITRTLIWVFVIIAAYLVLLVLVTIGAKAHDIYKDLQQPGSSMKCCGGEGPNADCEALDHTQIHEQNGSFVIDRGLPLSRGRRCVSLLGNIPLGLWTRWGLADHRDGVEARGKCT